MWRDKNTKGREREGKVGAGCSDPRSPPCGLGTCRFCNAKAKKFLKKIEKLILFRLFITRILIWKSGKNRGSFFLGGEGVGFPPSIPNAYTTDCFSSIIIFPPNFHLSITCRYRQIFVWVSVLDRLCHRIMCCSNVFAILVVKFVHFINIFDHQNDFSSAPPLIVFLFYLFCFWSLFFVVEKRQSIVKFHWCCGSALFDLRCIFQMLVRSQGRLTNTHLFSAT